MNEDKLLRRVVFASLIGATVEWYDFFLYGVVAGIVFNQLYFPAGNPVVATLLAYTTFAVGFVTRPLGGIIFGHFGDRLGRKSMLVLTLMIMGVATFLIGLVPTYAQIGIWAPITLLLLRILQGIGLGGEWGGAVLMTYEYAKPGDRGFYASLPQIGLSIGLCLASGVVALLSYLLTNEQFLSWGWRVGFILSFVLVIVGLYIRLNIMETPEFARLKEKRKEEKLPFAAMIADYPKQVFAGMGARYIDGVRRVLHLLSDLAAQGAAHRGVARRYRRGASDVRVHSVVWSDVRSGRSRARVRLGILDYWPIRPAGILALVGISRRARSGLDRSDSAVWNSIRFHLWPGSRAVLRFVPAASAVHGNFLRLSVLRDLRVGTDADRRHRIGSDLWGQRRMGDCSLLRFRRHHQRIVGHVDCCTGTAPLGAAPARQRRLRGRRVGRSRI
jgi:MFS family permease